jgi:glycosyltransferase involved in cell wall biosynthesis
MTERLTESEIDDLYAEADVFLLPSALLHAVSLTRALRAGLATVASDAFGVNEFIRHHVNGLITPGRRAMVGRGAADAFFSEDCRALLTPSPVPADLAFYHRFRAAVGLLADNPALRRRLSGNAARTAARSHDGRRWAAQLTGWVKARYLGSRNEDASRAT